MVLEVMCGIPDGDEKELTAILGERMIAPVGLVS